MTGKGECRTKVRGKPARRQGDLWARTAIDNTASRRFLLLPLCPAQTGGEHAPEHNTVHWHARSSDTPAHAPSGGVAARGTCPEGEKKGGHAAYRTPLCAAFLCTHRGVREVTEYGKSQDGKRGAARWGGSIVGGVEAAGAGVCWWVARVVFSRQLGGYTCLLRHERSGVSQQHGGGEAYRRRREHRGEEAHVGTC